jgi:hypothetical protein
VVVLALSIDGHEGADGELDDGAAARRGIELPRLVGSVNSPRQMTPEKAKKLTPLERIAARGRRRSMGHGAASAELSAKWKIGASDSEDTEDTEDTEEQDDLLANCRQMFSMVDTDDSGEIDRDELAVLCTKLGRDLKGRELDEAMEEMDTDGSGQVSEPCLAMQPCAGCCPAPLGHSDCNAAINQSGGRHIYSVDISQ